MQNDRSLDVIRSPAAQAALGPATADDLSLSAIPEQAVSAQPLATTYEEIPKRHMGTWIRFGALGAGALLLLVGGIFILLRAGHAKNNEVKAGEFGVVQLPLGEVKTARLSVDSAKSLKVNGQLQVSNSIVLTPISQPTNAVA